MKQNTISCGMDRQLQQLIVVLHDQPTPNYSLTAKKTYPPPTTYFFRGDIMAGTVEKRGKNSWRYGVRIPTDEGFVWERDTITFPDGMTQTAQRKKVNVLLAALIADLDAGRRVKPSTDHTLKSFSELWITEYVRADLSENVLKTYSNFLSARILPDLGDIRLKDLTPIALTQFINTLRTSPRRSTRKSEEKLKHKRCPADIEKMTRQPDKMLSARTVRHYYDCLNVMLYKATQWGFLAENPMDKVDRPRAPKTKAHFLTEERALELLRCLAREESMSFRAAVLLAVFCGLRLGEVGALRLSDVDWENGTIDITRALKYTPEKGNFEGPPKSEAGYRLIALPPGLMAVLHESREYQTDMASKIGDIWEGKGWIVHGWNGARLAHGTPSSQFRVFCRKNGFEDITFHSLRHTHATILLSNNIDAVAVASRLGHGDATITLQTYAHALRRRDEDAANASQRIMDKIGELFVKPQLMQDAFEAPPPEEAPEECKSEDSYFDIPPPNDI